MPFLGAIMVLASLSAFFVECILYLACAGWYFRLGPALHRQRWQTAASQAHAVETIDRARRNLKLVSRFRRPNTFLIRFRIWDASIWSRVVLHVVETKHGATISYEVRPFISPSFVAISVLFLFGFSPVHVIIFGYFMLIVLMYLLGWFWDLRKLRSLEPLRQELTTLGLSVCPTCGYDRFGLPAAAPCPECGTANP